MPKIIKTLSDALGESLEVAHEAHKCDTTRGLDDSRGVTSRREAMRSLAKAIAALQFDTPESRAILESVGVKVPPHLCRIISQATLLEIDREEASAAWDTPWDKGGENNEVKPHAGINTRRLSDVIAVPVQWLWHQRIPLGKLTLFNGDPDLGKTWILLDGAARVTTGRPFPDFPNTLGGPRDVLLCSAEDDEADTILPRFIQLKGDPSRFHTLQFVRTAVKNKDGTIEMQDHSLNLSADLEILDEWLRNHPLVVMVILDPFPAFLGKVDSHRNSDVRALLTPLTKLAAKRQVAIVGINHLNKGDGENAMYRGIGSIAFVAAARSSWMVTADPKEKDRRLFTKIKCNLQTEDVGGLAYRIGPHIPGAILWEMDPIMTTANESLRAPSSDTKAPALAEAKEWLRDLMKDGPVPAEDVLAKVTADMMCEKTVRKAAKELGISTKKSGGKGQPWNWTMPRT